MKAWIIRHCPDSIFHVLANIYYVLAGKPQNIIWKEKGGWQISHNGLTLHSPTSKFVGFGLSNFTQKFERYFTIEKGDVCLDVGACIGDTSVPMAMKCGKEGLVIAVEPHPTNAKYLKENLSTYHAIVITKALSNHNGEAKLHVHKTPTGHGLQPHPERTETINVELETLDNICPSATFAKIDVQGSELDVLSGGKTRFLQNVKKLVVETHGRYTPEATYPQVIKFLRGYFPNLKFDLDNGCVYCWR